LSFEVTDSPNGFAAGARCVGMLSLRKDFDVFGVAYRVAECMTRIWIVVRRRIHGFSYE